MTAAICWPGLPAGGSRVVSAMHISHWAAIMLAELSLVLGIAAAEPAFRCGTASDLS
jgi:hypothetical protein